MTMISLPRDILLVIISFCLNSTYRSGWTILLTCKYLHDLSISIKSTWFNPVYALSHAALHDKYEAASDIISSKIHLSTFDEFQIIRNAVVGGSGRMMRLLMDIPVSISFDDAVLLKTALIYKSHDALEIIIEHVEEYSKCLAGFVDYPHMFSSRTDDMKEDETCSNLLTIGRACWDMTMHPIANLDTFKLFWRIASSSLCTDSYCNIVPCTVNRDFIFDIMCSACSNGLLNIAQYIDKMTCHDYFHTAYYGNAFRNGHYDVLAWLYARFQDTRYENPISSDAMLHFFITWRDLSPESTRHNSYSKCFDFVMKDELSFHIEIMNDNVFEQIARLKHPKALNMFVQLYTKNEKRNHSLLNTSEVMVIAMTSGNVSIVEFMKGKIQRVCTRALRNITDYC